MHSYLLNKRFGLYFSVLLFVIIFSGVDARSQPSRAKITSPLTIINAATQEAECLVANVGTEDVTVNVVLVSGGTEEVNDDVVLEPNETAALQFAAVGGQNFFCAFNYTGMHSEIRAAARVVDLDPSADDHFPQRAEATEN